MSRALSILFAVGLTVLGLSGIVSWQSVGAAPNLLSNSTFDAGIAPWTIVDSNAGVGFATRDANGDPASGSAQMTAAASDGLIQSECITVGGDSVFEFAGAVLLPLTENSAGVQALVRVDAYDDPLCTSWVGSSPSAPVLPADDTWASAAGSLDTTGDIAQSLRVYLIMGGAVSGDVAYFDTSR